LGLSAPIGYGIERKRQSDISPTRTASYSMLAALAGRLATAAFLFGQSPSDRIVLAIFTMGHLEKCLCEIKVALLLYSGLMIFGLRSSLSV